jgi:hypothetical protein
MESNGNILEEIRGSDGKWLATNVFRPAALSFLNKGYYTEEPWGSPAWFDFWTEERRRCLDGYTVGKVHIPGEYYFYLNYCPIQKSEKTSNNTGTKVKGFPDFWDGDYNYFWVREIARNGVLYNNPFISEERKEEIFNFEPKEREIELVKLLDDIGLMFKIVPSIEKEGVRVENLLGGKDVIVLKSRRKGFSFKNASVGVCNFFHRKTAYTMQMAYDKKYLFPKGIFSMSMSYINFINENTAWKAPSDYVRKQDHIRNSYKTYKNGVEVESGYMSEIQAITFKDNPQAGVGKDCRDIIGEEVGAWGVPGGLKETVASMLPSVTDGDLRTGMLTLFGTSNDVEKGTVDFADMFENPESYTFLPFFDIWGDNDKKKEGFFFPVQLNLIGHYDSKGNSNLETGVQHEILERKKLEIGGATSSQLMQRMREFPMNSGEALTSISYNSFPVAELKQQLDKVKAEGWQQTKGTPVKLIYVGGQISAVPILDKSVEPITSYKNLPLDLKGCPVIYEQPVNNPPRGLYKIGYDPIDQESGSSLAAIIVYKSFHVGTTYHSIIVAEYVGRYEDPDDIDRVAEMFADLYATTIMHENMVTGVKNYFRRIKRLNLLAVQPDAVISKNVKNSKVARVYGCHMNIQLKDAGERYVKTWLLSVLDYDEHGNPIRVVDRIYSIRLLEELISYNRTGNFDLVSSLFMCLFQVQEEAIGVEYTEKKENTKVKMLLEMMKEMYVN